MSRGNLHNVTVVSQDGLIEDAAVCWEHGKITALGRSTHSFATVEESICGGGAYLAPGFIDLHIHGSKQFLTDNGPADLAGLCKLLPEYGTTGFLPTVCPLPTPRDAEFVDSLSCVRSEGAQILGFHLEGPFLTITGSLPADALGLADPRRVRALIEASKPYPAIFSISPDFEGITDLIAIMSANHVPVFMTHTQADVKQTQQAISAGACHATHFYDVFPIPEEREGGVRQCGAVEAILADERVSVDFILDGVHVDPVAVKMALRCKGPDGVCLITDANVGAGLPPGRYSFAGEEVEFQFQGAPARGTETSRYPGGLAGSGLTMDQAVRNAIEMLGVDLPQAVRMASRNPARVLGLDQCKGRLVTGFDADFVLLDKNLRVKQTWVAGSSVFSAP